jgi:hypothetical protein
MSLGDFEQVILLALRRLKGEAHGVAIAAEIGRRTSRQVSPGGQRAAGRGRLIRVESGERGTGRDGRGAVSRAERAHGGGPEFHGALVGALAT